MTPHIAVNGAVTKTGPHRRTAIDGRTTRHAGYAVSQRHRKRIEEIFGWIKSSASFAKVNSEDEGRSTPPSPSHWPPTT